MTEWCDVELSNYRTRSGGAVIDSHDAAAEFAKTSVNETCGLHHVADAALPRIELQRLRDITVGVCVAVHHQADRRADDREIVQVGATIKAVGRVTAVERQQAPARLQYSMDLCERTRHVRHVAQRVAAGHTVKRLVGK